MIAQISIIPIGNGVSLNPYIAKAVGIIKNSGLEHKVTDFGTTIEGDWDAVMDVVKRCHYTILEDAGRAYTLISVDERTDKQYKIGDKARKIESVVG